MTAEHLDELSACVLGLHLLRALSAVFAIAHPNVAIYLADAKPVLSVFRIHAVFPFAANPLSGFSRAAIALPIALSETPFKVLAAQNRRNASSSSTPRRVELSVVISKGLSFV